MNMKNMDQALSRRNLLRYGGLAGMVFGGGAVLAACGPSQDSKPGDPSTSSSDGGQDADGVQMSGRFLSPTPWTTSFVQDMVAREQGYFEEFGLDLKLDEGRESATSMVEITQGNADVTNAYGSTTLLALGEQDLPLTIVSCLRQAGQWELLSLPDRPITNASELEGKVLGVYSAGGTVAQLSTIILSRAGVPLSSVDRPVAKGPAAYELARQGEIDAWIDLDSNRARLQLEFGELNYINTDEFAPMPSAAMLFHSDTVRERPEMPIAYMAAMYRAVDFIKDEANWERVTEIVQKYNRELSFEDLEVGLSLLIEQWYARGEENLFDINVPKWQAGAKDLLDAEVLETEVDVLAHIDESILVEAKALAGS